MAGKIILSGASSVGKTTVANDWCLKHKTFVHIQEVARDVMREGSITRDDLEASLRTNEKLVFLKLQHAILEEQNKRELAVPKGSSFISDRGPDPLIFANQYVGNDAADRLARTSAGKACLERYRSSLVLVLCPLEKPTDDGFRMVPTTSQQHKFTCLLREFLDRYCIPYLYISETDRHHRIALIEKAVKGEFQIQLDLDTKCYPLNIPFILREQPSQLIISLWSLQFSIDNVQCSFKKFSQGKSNRMINQFGKDKFVLASFDKKVSPHVVVKILQKGMLINGEEYNFLGCSSSGLRSRSCYLYKGTKDEVRAVLDECGSFSQIKSVSVRLKRIGLLFSEAIPTSIELSDGDIIEMEDIEKGPFNFTDGCGAISNNLATRIKDEAKLLLTPTEYLPCVFQIRYQGCKGVVMIDPDLTDKQIMIRKSMKKFNPGRIAFRELWLCDHSRPYSYGHLNKQFIMLLSGLGVKDEIFLCKQREHFRRLEEMNVNPMAAVEMLQWNNQPGLATRAVKCNKEELKSDGILQMELKMLKSKLIEKLEKLHLLIPESRTVFGVCDPLGELQYGECFFRPTICGEPCTLSGYVTVAKNPCYLLGDVRRLKTVSDSQRVRKLEHLIDCIVFPTSGKQPHPNEIAGSDLDGDQYFVCWEKDLIIPTTCEPYDYLPSESKRNLQLTTVEYFAQQNEQSRTMSKIDSYFKYWADRKGIKCKECKELGMHFAHSVDSAKTGVKVSIPKNLVPPKCNEQEKSIEPKPVWTQMEEAAMKEKCKLREHIFHNTNPEVVTEEFVWSLLQDEELNMSEFQLFNFVKQWCNQQYSADEALETLMVFSDYVNFSKFTVEQQKAAMDVGIPRDVVANALNKSQLLTPSMRAQFFLDSPHCDWKFYFRFNSTTIEGHHLIRAFKRYSEIMVIFQLPNTMKVALHFLTQLSPGVTRLNAGSVIAYFFSPHFGLSQRYVLGSEYTIELDNEMLQLYRDKKEATFVKLAFEDKEKSTRDRLDETVYDQISVDLTRFKRDILTKLKHPKVRKENFHCIEVFVKQPDHQPAHFDILLADFPGELSDEIIDDTVEEVPFEEQTIEEKEINLESMETYVREVVLSELQGAACSGNPGHYDVLLQFILSNESDLSHFSNNLQSSLMTLLTTMVAACNHKLSNADIADSLETIIVTLHSCLKTPQTKLKILDSLFKLQFSSLANQIVKGMQVSTGPDYFEAVLDWKLWCFLPQDIAHEILDVIKPQVTSPENVIPGDFSDETNLQSAISEYTVHFADLLGRHFIHEFHETKHQSVRGGSYIISQLKAYELKHSHNLSESVVSPSKKPVKWRVGFTKDTSVSITKLTIGTFVMISPMKLSSKAQVPIAVLGQITEVCKQPTNIVVEFEEPIPHCLRLSAKQSKGHWELNLIGNVIAFKRSIKAIKKIVSERLDSTELLPVLVCPQKCLADSTLSHTLESTPEVHSASPQRGVASSISQDISNSYTFNESQQKAIDAAVTQQITLIHGPPGTGKTHTATEIVQRVCQRYSSGKSKVLVAAETNMAVDNLTRKLLQRNVMVVRVGNIEHMSDDVRHVSLEHQLQMKYLELGREKCKNTNTNTQVILSAAEVIATTCTGAGDSVLKGLVFPFVLIDEATQATEPVSLIPIVHKCRQLVLIGDPQQLPPTMINPMEKSHTLSRSLFHRLHEVFPSVFLEEQHRMHPAIAEFPSKTFYSGKLKSASGLEKRTNHFNFIWSNKERPLLFLDVKSSREQHCGVSFQNVAEANVVVKTVVHLLSNNISQTEIAALTPYAGQVRHIREKLGQIAKCVEVCSVDGFQGREKEVIIFSTVRTQTLGFTGDKHRINVLLTRAKHVIIGVGCSKALSADSTWASWLEQVHIEDSEGFLQPKQEVRTGKEIPKGNIHAICKNIEKGCRYGDKCKFAHSQIELDQWIHQSTQTRQLAKEHLPSQHIRRPKGRVYRLCKFIEQGCRDGDKCRYAHSQAELDEWRALSKP